MTTLITIVFETDGSSTSGVCKAKSTAWYGELDYIRIPRGLKAKIWCKRVSGEVETKFKLEYCRNVKASSPTWMLIGEEILASKGVIELEKRRPIVLEAPTGLEAFRVSWEQPTAGRAVLELEVEFADA